MYRIMATMLHEHGDSVEVYSDEVFDSEQVAESWINSKEGYLFAQDIMVGIDINEYMDGYWLESLTVKPISEKEPITEMDGVS